MGQVDQCWQRKIGWLTCWLQALYYVVFGIWPLLHRESFQAVTGPKTDHLVTGHEGDHWLVNTVALLITSVGVVLLLAAWRQTVTLEISMLGALSALSLATIDVLYFFRNTISPVYLPARHIPTKQRNTPMWSAALG